MAGVDFASLASGWRAWALVSGEEDGSGTGNPVPGPDKKAKTETSRSVAGEASHRGARKKRRSE